MKSLTVKIIFNCIFLTIFSQSVKLMAADIWQLQYFEDKAASLSPYDILIELKNGNFITFPNKNLNPGFTTSYFWLAITRVSSVSNSKEQQYLVLNNPHINRLHWYVASVDSTKLVNETGDYLPYHSRALDYTNFAFPLANDDSLYLLKIDKRHETLQFNAAIVGLDEIRSKDVQENLFYGIFSGAVFILLVLSIFIYISTKQKIYLLFFMHVLLEALWLLADKGFGMRYLWTDFIFFAIRSRMLFTLLGMVASIAFAKNFIRLNRDHWHFKSLSWIQYIAASTAILLILPLPYDRASWMVNILATISVTLWGIVFIIVPIIVITQWSMGVKEAKIFALSHIPVLVLGMLFNFNIIGAIGLPEILLDYGLAFGNLITMLILIFGITFIFNEFKTENLQLLSKINEQQKLLTQRVLEAQELERKAIGQAIHDEVSAKLSVTMLHLSAIKSPQPAVAEAISSVHGNLVNVRDILRELSHQLLPIDLEKYGLKQSIEGFFNSVVQSGKLNIEYVIEGFATIESSNMAFKAFVYRAILEFTNNIIKHSGASHVLFQLIEINHSLTIVVEDNGNGFDTKNTTDGYGLALIKAQIVHYRGTFELQSNIGTGTSIIIELPIAKA